MWPHAYIAKIPKFGFREFFRKFELCHDKISLILRILEPRKRFSKFLLSPVLAFFGHLWPFSLDKVLAWDSARPKSFMDGKIHPRTCPGTHFWAWHCP